MGRTRIRCTLITPEYVVYDCWIRGFIRKYYFTIVVNKKASHPIIPTKEDFSYLGGELQDTYREMLRACEEGAKFIFESSTN